MVNHSLSFRRNEVTEKPCFYGQKRFLADARNDMLSHYPVVIHQHQILTTRYKILERVAEFLFESILEFLHFKPVILRAVVFDLDGTHQGSDTACRFPVHIIH